MKRFIAEQNGHEGAAGSNSIDADAPSTPATETTTEDGSSAPGVGAAQDGVDN